MSIKKISPLEALLVSNLPVVLVPSEKNNKFVEAYNWAKCLYPSLFVSESFSRVPLDIDWEFVLPGTELSDVENTLLKSAHCITFQVAGPANAIAATISYLNANYVMLKHSPSATTALSRFLSRLF